jgi:hypothetical protein
VGGWLAVKFTELAEILERELGRDLAARCCAALRREASGEDVYIPRRDGPPAILPTDTPRTVQARYGVPARKARDWVHRWRS